jgi:hypothetical protein
MTASRRLAAILAIDVVGYSRLMGEDEAGTARAVGEAARISGRRVSTRIAPISCKWKTISSRGSRAPWT